jgi:tetratricopeptide (TPR) repeat protein
MKVWVYAAVYICYNKPIEHPRGVLPLDKDTAMIPTDRHIARLLEHDLIRPDDDAPEVTYYFRHALVQDAAYASVLRVDRLRLHAAVGAALETLYPDNHDELASLLAYHFHGAGDDARALHYYTLAGKRARESYAGAEAEAHFRAALSLNPTPRERADLLAWLGEAQFDQSHFPDAIATWETALAAYHALGRPDEETWIAARITRATWYTGNMTKAVALALGGLAGADQSRDSVGLAALLHEAGRSIILSHGSMPDARRMATQALEMAQRLGARDIESDTLVTLSILPDQPVDIALDQLQIAAALSEAIGRPAIASRAYYNLADLYINQRGEVRTGLAYATQAAAASRQLGHAAGELLSLIVQAECALLLGDLAAAAPLLDQVARLQYSRSASREGETPAMLALRGIFSMTAGDWVAAETYSRAGLDGARGSDDYGSIQMTAHTLAYMGLVTGQPAVVPPAVADALAARDQNNRSVDLYCLAAVAHAALGDPAAADAAITTARTRDALTPTDRADLAQATARLAVIAGDTGAALPAFAEAVALYAACGLRPYQAQMLIEWAAALAAQGDRAGAAARLREALALYALMPAPLHLARVQAQLEALHTPTG